MAVTIRENDVKASNLFFLCLALSLLSFCFHLFKLTFPTSTIFFILAIHFQLAAIAVGVRAGQPWAKVVLVLIALIGIGTQLRTISGLSTIDMAFALLFNLLYTWSAGIVVKDLFTRRSAIIAERL